MIITYIDDNVEHIIEHDINTHAYTFHLILDLIMKKRKIIIIKVCISNV